MSDERRYVCHHVDEHDDSQKMQNCDDQRKRSDHDEGMRSESNSHVGLLKIDDSELRNDHSNWKSEGSDHSDLVRERSDHGD